MVWEKQRVAKRLLPISMFLISLVFFYSCSTDNSDFEDSVDPDTDEVYLEDMKIDLDHDQRFVIPSDAEIGDVVGEKNANPNWKVRSAIVFSKYGRHDDGFAVSEGGVITVEDPTKISSGTFTITLRAVDGAAWDESICTIEVKSADDCAFVDAESITTDSYGTREAPYKSIAEGISSGKNIVLLKRGSIEERLGNCEPRNRPGILIGAYGKGARPILEFHGEDSRGKILSLSSSEGGEVRDIHTRVSNPATVGFITGRSPDSVFDNCVSEGSHYGFRIMAGSSGSKVLNSKIFDIQADGMYTQNAQNIEIGYNTIWDVAQNGNVDGDCVQFSNVGTDYNNTGWYVHHNKMDRSGTVGKFCLILGGNVFGEVGRVEYNWMIGDPDAVGTSDTGSSLGITHFYLSPVEEISIVGNTFENTSNNGIYIRSGCHNVYIENNIFNNTGDVAISGPNSSETILYVRHNLIYECAFRAGGAMNNFHGATVEFQNNICFNTRVDSAYSYGTVSEDYNLYSAGGLEVYSENSIEGVPLFVDADSADFHLDSGSLGVDMGIGISEVSIDIEGRSRPLGEGVDIGPYEQ